MLYPHEPRQKATYRAEMSWIKNLQTGELFTGVAHAEKYQSGNWLARRLVRNFMDEIHRMVLTTGHQEVFEVGCGEGHILGRLAMSGLRVRGCDVSAPSLAVAYSESARNGLDIALAEKSIYDLTPENDAADLVLCCEVLEHLTEPERALQKLMRVARRDLILSVPNEPIWHILNMCRGKYFNALGNTPGHYQHWTPRQFLAFVGRHVDIVSVKTPLPWTLVHCRPRQ